jgi:hypothetical protein
MKENADKTFKKHKNKGDRNDADHLNLKARYDVVSSMNILTIIKIPFAHF